MLRTGILLVTFIVTAVSIGLIGRILCESNAKTGILTLSFNSTNIVPDNPFLKSRTVQNRDIFQDIQSKVNSVKDAIATALPDAVATPIQEIEEYIPKNCSLGTKEFCVGYRHNITCKKLPLSLSDLVPDIAQNLPDGVQVLPDTLEKPLQDLVKEFQEKLQEKLQPLGRILTKVTTPYVQKCLVAGLVLLRVVQYHKHSSKAHYWIESGNGLRLGLFQAKTKALPSWIEVEKGEVGGLCIGALCCAIVMTFLTAITPTVI
ncbi:hypothetical protein K469DRAFT_698391 [Zopfia rhizophila CBS 207.26]|uniref:Uncharacterized protein n=1 Tax=Zopfia rhizophila CBS 207.26 TaxID=1314779 RepID=A0A6A6DAG0_9PEZI|nr:hypothetical protein K469DRAFT_698391 [Zopfia rhizophila CBS 207.26]